jgi:hypothetical protein
MGKGIIWWKADENWAGQGHKLKGIEIFTGVIPHLFFTWYWG